MKHAIELDDGREHDRQHEHGANDVQNNMLVDRRRLPEHREGVRLERADDVADHVGSATHNR
jgi:hypothetical protein